MPEEQGSESARNWRTIETAARLAPPSQISSQMESNELGGSTVSQSHRNTFAVQKTI